MALKPPPGVVLHCMSATQGIKSRMLRAYDMVREGFLSYHRVTRDTWHRKPPTHFIFTDYLQTMLKSEGIERNARR